MDFVKIEAQDGSPITDDERQHILTILGVELSTSSPDYVRAVERLDALTSYQCKLFRQMILQYSKTGDDMSTLVDRDGLYFNPDTNRARIVSIWYQYLIEESNAVQPLDEVFTYRNQRKKSSAGGLTMVPVTFNETTETGEF